MIPELNMGGKTFVQSHCIKNCALCCPQDCTRHLLPCISLCMGGSTAFNLVASPHTRTCPSHMMKTSIMSFLMVTPPFSCSHVPLFDHFPVPCLDFLLCCCQHFSFILVHNRDHFLGVPTRANIYTECWHKLTNCLEISSGLYPHY